MPGGDFYPRSDIGVQSDFLLPPSRLAAAFGKGVAGCDGTKLQARCRRQDERAWKAVERLSRTRQGGLMTDLGLIQVLRDFCKTQNARLYIKKIRAEKRTFAEVLFYSLPLNV